MYIIYAKYFWSVRKTLGKHPPVPGNPHAEGASQRGCSQNINALQKEQSINVKNYI